ncbi:MAG TPA: M48 family metalloprotease [Fimbriimonadales bacterium]|nr:M48 family metalloprotease [Fimbriimonadales bacterium]
MKVATFVFLIVSTVLSLIASLMADVETLGSRLLLGGGLFVLLVTFSQIVLGLCMHPAVQHIRGKEWTKSFLTERLVAMGWMVALPVGTTAILIGSFENLFHSPSGTLEKILLVSITFCAIVLWCAQWNALHSLMLPGKLARFPREDWERSARELAERMGISFRALMLIQTRDPHSAAALALTGGRIAFSDVFLNSLTKEEFLAVAAHEIEHLKQKRITTKFFFAAFSFSLIIGIAIWWFTEINFLSEQIAPVLALGLSCAVLLVSFLFKKSREDAADVIAVRYTDASSFIRALAIHYALNDKLIDAKGEFDKGLLRRSKRIAQEGGLSEEELRSCLVSAERYSGLIRG